MTRGYRKKGSASNGRRPIKSHDGQGPCKSQPPVIDRDEALAAGVALELPVSLASVIEGVSEEIEHLAAAAGLLIMREVMEAEVTSLAGPKGKHDGFSC